MVQKEEQLKENGGTGGGAHASQEREKKDYLKYIFFAAAVAIMAVGIVLAII